jgi:hypothetical protein
MAASTQAVGITCQMSSAMPAMKSPFSIWDAEARAAPEARTCSRFHEVRVVRHPEGMKVRDSGRIILVAQRPLGAKSNS